MVIKLHPFSWFWCPKLQRCSALGTLLVSLGGSSTTSKSNAVGVTPYLGVRKQIRVRMISGQPLRWKQGIEAGLKPSAFLSTLVSISKARWKHPDLLWPWRKTAKQTSEVRRRRRADVLPSCSVHSRVTDQMVVNVPRELWSVEEEGGEATLPAPVPDCRMRM